VLLLQPHLPVINHRGEPTNFVALGGPLGTQYSREVQKALLARARPIVGFTSHKLFPIATAEMAGEYLKQCIGWCHCFRDTKAFSTVPQIDLSHSDLVDIDYVSPRNFGRSSAQWDYVYVCMPGAEVESAKGWQLARQCIDRLSRAGLEGVLVGRSLIRDLPVGARVIVRPRLRWRDFLQCLGAARSLLVTSTIDASPRVVAEALALNRPIVLHHDILGGWKYINGATGAFFSRGDEVVETIKRVVAGPASPREWYCDSFGLRRSGSRLKDFLNALGGDIHAPYVTLGSVPAIDPVGCVNSVRRLDRFIRA
jgi:glycosyltransferase involved in cell wall biosynthesis